LAAGGFPAENRSQSNLQKLKFLEIALKKNAPAGILTRGG